MLIVMKSLTDLKIRAINTLKNMEHKIRMISNLTINIVSLNIVFKGKITTISLDKDSKISKPSVSTVKRSTVVNAVKQWIPDLHESCFTLKESPKDKSAIQI